MSKQEKPKFPKALMIYLIAIPIILLSICFIAIVSGSSVNWIPFFLLILLLDGIPLLIYLLIHAVPWSKLTSKQKDFIKYVSFAIVAIFFVGIISYTSCGSCVGCGDGDGICDDAGCSKRATTSFGGEMEFCLEHYIEWSSRARK